MKLLTIGIPTYNRFEILSKTLPLTMRVLNSFAHDVELLISDNGSDPKVKNYIYQQSKDYSNVRVVGFNNNKGFKKNYLNLIKKSESRFIWIIGSDDFLLGDNFESLINLLKITDAKYLYTTHNRVDLRSLDKYKHQQHYDFKYNTFDKLVDILDPKLIDPLLGSLTTAIIDTTFIRDKNNIEEIIDQKSSYDLSNYFPQSILSYNYYLESKAIYISTPLVVVGDGAREWSSSNNSQISYWGSSLPYLHFVSDWLAVDYLKSTSITEKALKKFSNKLISDYGYHFIKLFSIRELNLRKEFQEKYSNVVPFKNINIFLSHHFYLGLIIGIYKGLMRKVKHLILRKQLKLKIVDANNDINFF